MSAEKFLQRIRHKLIGDRLDRDPGKLLHIRFNFRKHFFNIFCRFRVGEDGAVKGHPIISL